MDFGEQIKSIRTKRKIEQQEQICYETECE